MKKKNSGRVSIILFIVMLLVAVAIGVFVMLSSMLNSIGRISTRPGDVIAASMESFEVSTSEPDTLKAEEINFNADNIEVMRDNDIKNILLIGQDMRSTSTETRQRSDTMIICSINTRTNEISLSSLMRDMYVHIPGYSDNKMNAAYYFGGIELLDQTVMDNFGIEIDGNVVVDLEAFVSAVTQVGSLEIELSEEEAEYMNANPGLGLTVDPEEALEKGMDIELWNLQPGMNELNSAQLLCYCRMRYVGNSDWERTERQRNVLIAAFKKVKDSGYGEMIKLARAVIPYVLTDMTDSEILSYVKTVAVNDISVINSYRLPVEGHYTGGTINGMSVLIPDLTMNSQYLKHYIYGTEIDESLALTPDYTAEADDTSGADGDYTYDAGAYYSDDVWYPDNTYDYTAPDDTVPDTSGSSYVPVDTSGQQGDYDAGTMDTPQDPMTDPAMIPADPGMDTGAADGSAVVADPAAG